MIRLVPIHATRVNAEGSLLSRSIKQTREGSLETTESCSATTSRQYTKPRQLLFPFTHLVPLAVPNYFITVMLPPMSSSAR